MLAWAGKDVLNLEYRLSHHVNFKLTPCTDEVVTTADSLNTLFNPSIMTPLPPNSPFAARRALSVDWLGKARMMGNDEFVRTQNWCVAHHIQGRVIPKSRMPKVSRVGFASAQELEEAIQFCEELARS